MVNNEADDRSDTQGRGGNKADILVKEPNTKSGEIAMLGIIAVLIVIFVLSFHFVTVIPKLIPKDHLTFKYSIITQSDIDTLISRYNHANVFERVQMRSDPLYNTLREQGLIVDVKDSTNE